MTQANWIWTTDWQAVDETDPRLVLFRKSFNIAHKTEKAVMRITADSRYKLFVNGVFVQVGPLRGSIEQWYFDEIDLKPYLSVGRNVIAVAVLKYPAIHMKGNFGICRTEMPGLRAQLDLDGAESVVTDGTWLSYKDDKFKIVSEDGNFAPLQIYEQTSGDAILNGWNNLNYDTGKWAAVKTFDDNELPTVLQNIHVKKRPIPFMKRQQQTFKEIKRVIKSAATERKWARFLQGLTTVTIEPHQNEIVEISAGKEMTAYLILKFLGGKGAHVRLLQSESYVEGIAPSVNGLTLYQKENREDSQNGYLIGFEDNYDVAGYGKDDQPEQYTPFWFRTFRFIRLEIQTKDEPLTLEEFDFDETRYPWDFKTHVKTNDPTLERIWQISKRSLECCTHETYEDCPFYEQLQYVMDTRVQMLYTYQTTADDRLARQAIYDFRYSQQADGLLNAAFPSYEPNVIPTFSIFYIKMLQDHMMYFGDKRLIRKNLPTAEKILDYFNSQLNEKGYVNNLGGLNGQGPHWSFIDWAPEWNTTTGVPTAVLKGPVTMESLLYLYGLQSAIALAKFVDKKDLAKEYQTRADRLQVAIRKYCIGQNGLIQDGPGVDEYSQHAQVFGILTDTLTLEEGKRNLKLTVDHPDNYAQCSVAMSFYLFRALEKTGLYELSDHYWNIWREMISKNLTTSVESAAAERSECHAWGALALYELPAVILGVRPAVPGYQKIKINPQPGYLTVAQGHVITPRGMVEVKWQRVNGQMNVDYQVPQGVEVEQ